MDVSSANNSPDSQTEKFQQLKGKLYFGCDDAASFQTFTDKTAPKGLRRNSPFYKIFTDIIGAVEEDLWESLEQSGVPNPFYSEQLVSSVTLQYLSLYPILSACFTEKLYNNTYVELHWRDHRSMMKDIPDRKKFCNVYFGKIKSRMRQLTRESQMHTCVPNLKLKKKQRVTPSKPQVSKDVFIPTPLSMKKTFKKEIESHSRSREMWDSKKTPEPKKEPMMKGKALDFSTVDKLITPKLPDLTTPTKVTNTMRKKDTCHHRFFLNPDMTLCWMNSCLQALLTVLDHIKVRSLKALAFAILCH